MAGFVVLFFDGLNELTGLFFCFNPLKLADKAGFFNLFLKKAIFADGFVGHKKILSTFAIFFKKNPNKEVWIT